MNNNIIVTGPPRSGTTLTCFLLNKVDNTVALHEPMNLQMFSDKETGVSSVISFFDEMRTSLLKDGTAISKVKDGEIPDNPFGDSKEKKRNSLVSKNVVRFDKELTADFNLVIKHNGHFTYLLPELEILFPTYVILRNPVATIASWNSISAPVSEGNLRVLEYLNPVLFKELNAIPDLITRQVMLLHSMYDLYSKSSKSTFIKYEDIISTQGAALSVITSNAGRLQESLQSKNTNPLYNESLISNIKDTLVNMKGAYLNYYTVESLINY